ISGAGSGPLANRAGDLAPVSGLDTMILSVLPDTIVRCLTDLLRSCEGDRTTRSHYSVWVYDRRCRMQRMILVAFTMLCLVGVGSLTLADDAMKTELDKMKADIKGEKEAMKADVKAEQDAMKAKKQEMKDKTKANKNKMKAKQQELKDKGKVEGDDMKAGGQEMKAAGQSMEKEMKATGQDMKTAGQEAVGAMTGK